MSIRRVGTSVHLTRIRFPLDRVLLLKRDVKNSGRGKKLNNKEKKMPGDFGIRNKLPGVRNL